MSDFDFETTFQYRYRWATIAVEPQVDSGEQINVHAVIVDSDGVHVEPLIDKRHLEAIFGNRAKFFENIALLVVSLVHDLYSKAGTIESIEKYVAGTRISSFRSARSTSYEAAIESIKKNNSYILNSNINQLALEVQKRKQAEKQSQYWVNRVKDEVVQVNAELSRYFGQKKVFESSKTEIKYGFYSARLLANFSVLDMRNHSYLLMNSKSKIADLVIFKQSTELVKPEKYRLFLKFPDVSRSNMSKETEFKLHSYLDQVNQFARSSSIDLIKVATEAEAAGELASYY